MKILSKEQIYEADKLTAKNQKISSVELMERAGIRVFNWIHSRLQGQQVKIHILCGIGNNGGDGMVVGRHLKTHGYNVEVYVVNFSDKRSEDFLTNLSRLKELKYWPKLIVSEDEFPQISKDEIIIDAIFGIGLNRKPIHWVNGLIKKINHSNAFVLSIDIPSGLYMDSLPDNSEHVIKANFTLTFQTPKLIFFLPQTGIYTNEWDIVDIGLDHDYIKNVKSEVSFILKDTILPFYIPREKFTHKGTYGHSLIIGGSYGKIGAVILSAKACLKTGAGLVTTFIPKCGYTSIQTAIPECMVLTDKEENSISHIKYDIKPTVIGLGIGIGQDKKTVETFKNLLSFNNIPMVIDADGINILAHNASLIDNISPNSVLTPHPKELERLIGKWTDDFDKLKKAKKFSSSHKCILVIKGANTITVFENNLYINSTGNPGMATAGSGDVLTGIITGLISQGYEPLQATIFGVYIHGRAGDLSTLSNSYESIIASDIIDNIGNAFIDLFKQINNNEDKDNSNNSGKVV